MKNTEPQIPKGLTRISAVVVAYFPDDALLENLRRISSQVSEVIVVDNGSEGVSAQTVEMAGNLPRVQLIHNGANLGIATALNIGIRRALQSGCQWVATFDQDGVIPEQYFRELLHTYEFCPSSEKVGMIIPGEYSSQATATVKPGFSGNPPFTFVLATMSSGSLIKAEVFTTAGFYDDAMFIDYVDADFCLRLQKNGFKILSAASVVLHHQLGTKQTRNFLGFQVSFRIHTAWRYYYIMRNRVLVYRRYFLSFPRWSLRDAFFIPLELGRIAILENGRCVKLRSALLGIWDGLCGRSGRHVNFPAKISSSPKLTANFRKSPP